MKLGTYNGSTCLETLLAAVKNFATYYRWTDESFCLNASLHGPAGQLLWDLGLKVTLVDLV